MDCSNAEVSLTAEELYREHAGFVVRFLARLGVSAEFIEDALQDVFLVVHRHGGYRPGLAKPTSYLANLAIHAAAKYKYRQRRDTNIRTQLNRAPGLMYGAAVDPGRDLELRRDMLRLERALSVLPEHLRVVLLLVEVEGESCVSVAAGLHCPVGTVYSRLHKARRLMRIELGETASTQRLAPTFLIWFGLFDFQWSRVAKLFKPTYRAAPSTSSMASLIWGPATAALMAVAFVASVTFFVDRGAAAPETPRAIALARYEPPATLDTRPADSYIAESMNSPQPAEPMRARGHNRRTRSTKSAHALDQLGQAAATQVAESTVVARASNSIPNAGVRAEGLENKPAAAPPARSDSAPKQIDSGLEEAQLLSEAERQLAGNTKRALTMLRAMRTRFTHGYLLEERAYLELVALDKLGHASGELREQGNRFLAAYPTGVYSARVRALIKPRP